MFRVKFKHFPPVSVSCDGPDVRTIRSVGKHIQEIFLITVNNCMMHKRIKTRIKRLLYIKNASRVEKKFSQKRWLISDNPTYNRSRVPLRYGFKEINEENQENVDQSTETHITLGISVKIKYRISSNRNRPSFKNRTNLNLLKIVTAPHLRTAQRKRFS